MPRQDTVVGNITYRATSRAAAARCAASAESAAPCAYAVVAAAAASIWQRCLHACAVLCAALRHAAQVERLRQRDVARHTAERRVLAGAMSRCCRARHADRRLRSFSRFFAFARYALLFDSDSHIRHCCIVYARHIFALMLYLQKLSDALWTFFFFFFYYADATYARLLFSSFGCFAMLSSSFCFYLL